ARRPTELPRTSRLGSARLADILSHRAILAAPAGRVSRECGGGQLACVASRESGGEGPPAFALTRPVGKTSRCRRQLTNPLQRLLTSMPRAPRAQAHGSDRAQVSAP